MVARINEEGVKAALSVKLRELPPGLLATLAVVFDGTVAAGQYSNHAWLGSSPSIKEWIGKRKVSHPAAFDFAIRMKKWSNDGVMPLDLLNHDKTGEAQMWLDDFIASRPLHYEELIADLIVAAETALCFTGHPFFDTDHSFGDSGAFNNDLTYNAANENAVTPYEAALAISAAIEAMRSFPDDQGRKIANRGMTAVDVLAAPGSANAAALRTAITSKTLDTGAGSVDNPLAGQDVNVQFNSDGLLTLGATKFVVARSRRLGDVRARPFVIERTIDDQSLYVLGPNNSPATVVEHDGVLIAIKEVDNAGYGLPTHAVLTTFT